MNLFIMATLKPRMELDIIPDPIFYQTKVWEMCSTEFKKTGEHSLQLGLFTFSSSQQELDRQLGQQLS